MCRGAHFFGGWILGLSLVGVLLHAADNPAEPSDKLLNPPVSTQDPTLRGALLLLRTKLADPGFRWRAERCIAIGPLAVAHLTLSAQEQAEVYAWLNAQPQPPQSAQGIPEARLLAWLARELQRPEAEILKADDRVIAAAPDLAEGWLHRASTYAAGQGTDQAQWALDTYFQALRHVHLAEGGLRELLNASERSAWLARVTKAGRQKEMGAVLEELLRAAPHGEARWEASDLVLEFLKDDSLRAQPQVMEGVLDATREAQPHLPLHLVSDFIELAKKADAAHASGVARRIARLLIESPAPWEVVVDDPRSPLPFEARWSMAHRDPPELALETPEQAAQSEAAQEQNRAQLSIAMGIRGGYRTLAFCWEDTLPRYKPETKARFLLDMAMGGEDAKDFAARILAAAREQPWNENLLSYALLARALQGSVRTEDLTLAASLDVAARGRLALRLCSFAPVDHLPLADLCPWLEAGASALIRQSRGQPSDRATFDELLLSMNWLEKAGQGARLHTLLHSSLEIPPRPVDPEHWDRLAELMLRYGNAQDARDLLERWRSSLSRSVLERNHLTALVHAAMLGGPERGADFAELAFDIWTRRYENDASTRPDPAVACRVAEALLTCKNMDTFARLQQRLESRHSVLGSELKGVAEMLAEDTTRLPQVDAWLQESAAPETAPRLQWQFVFPVFGPEPAGLQSHQPEITIRAGPARVRRFRPQPRVVPGLADESRWWAPGKSHPVLARLDSRFDLDIWMGDSPEHLQKVSTVSEVPATGSALLPPGVSLSGCVKVMLRARTGGATQFSDPRPYSLKPLLFTTGREPDASSPMGAPSDQPEKPIPLPGAWQKHDAERWGRLLAPPVPIDGGTEYLLTQWTTPHATSTQEDADEGPTKATPAPDQPLEVQLILLDEKRRPLGPVPLVSTGFAGEDKADPTVVYRAHRAHTQVFRPGDWAGDLDVVKPRKKEDTDGVARYMALVTRTPGTGPLPLLQLRAYRDPPAGHEADVAKESLAPEMPELNPEYIASVGFRVLSWHVTMGPERGIFVGRGALAGFDVGHIPWKPLVRSESSLITGLEWPMCFEVAKSLIVEPSWVGNRTLGARLVPFSIKGSDYGACARKELPLPTYNLGELSPRLDGALLMVSSQSGPDPKPVAAWLEPDGSCSVLPLPRPPLTGSPGLVVAWWGPEEKLTLYEDGLLFHLQHLDGLRLLKVEPGDPSQVPPGCQPGRNFEKPQWTLEQPDVLAELDPKTSEVVRRFHLPQRCEGEPMTFDDTSPVMLFTTSHDIIRVNPPPLRPEKAE